MAEERLSKNKISERNQKRREMLAGFLYDIAKLTFSGVGIGGLSPLVTGDAMNVYNYLCLIFGVVATLVIAFIANSILRLNVEFKAS